MALKTKYVGSVHFSSWGNSIAGALLPSDNHNCLEWSHGKFKTHDLLTWLNDICNGLVQWTSFVMVSVLANYISGLFALTED